MPLNINDDMPIGRPPSGKIGSRQPPAISAPDRIEKESPAPMLAPDVLTSGARPPMLAPDVLASKTPGLTAPPFPLNHARILWQNKLIGGFAFFYGGGQIIDAKNVLTPATYTRAVFVAGDSTLYVNTPGPQSFDAVGIAAHTMPGATVEFRYRKTSGQWALGFSGTLGPGSFFRQLAATVTDVDQVAFTMIGVPAGATIAVVYVGDALQMQRPIYRGVDPAPLNRVTEYTNNVSEGGQWLGRDITRQGLKTKPRWQNLDPVWLRSYFDPFASAARRLPFFYSWNPLEFPNDVAYCWTSKDIQPSITGPRNLMSVEIEMEGHA